MSATPSSPGAEFDPDAVDLRTESDYRFWLDEHVRFADLDTLGHANNNAFGVYFESGRVHFMRSNGVVDGVNNRGIVVARITINFLAEMAYRDSIRIGIRPIRLGHTSITLGSAIFRDGEATATSWAVAVHIDTSSRRPTPLDDELRARLTALM